MWAIPKTLNTRLTEKPLNHENSTFPGFPVYQQVVEIGFEPFSIPGHAPQRLTIKRVKREYLQKNTFRMQLWLIRFPGLFHQFL